MCCLGVVRCFVLVLGMHFRMLKFYLTNMPIISTGIQIKMLCIQFRFVLITVTVPYLNRVVHSICESFTMCRLSPFVYWQGPLNLYISIVKVLDFTQTDLAFDLSSFFHLLGFFKCALNPVSILLDACNAICRISCLAINWLKIQCLLNHAQMSTQTEQIRKDFRSNPMFLNFG